MDRAEATAFLDFNIVQAEQMIIAGGHIVPMAILSCQNTAKIIIPMPWTDIKSKRHYMNFARLACIAYPVQSVTLVSEAWIGLSTDTPDNKRLEVVVISVEWDGGYVGSWREIQRDEAGQVTGLDMEVRFPPDFRPEGRYARMLPPQVPSAKVRASALALMEELDCHHVRVPASGPQQ